MFLWFKIYNILNALYEICHLNKTHLKCHTYYSPLIVFNVFTASDCIFRLHYA